MGTSFVGRDATCEIRLSDSMVSKRHAKLHITSVPELVDANSSNGILVDDEPVSRIVLRPDDVVVVGETSLAVAMLRGGGDAGDVHGTAIPFIRSPRVSPLFVGTEMSTPDLPQTTATTRLPIIPLIIPIVLGAVLYLITKNALSIAFVALSPAMLAGNFLEARTTRRRTFAQDMARFREQLSLIDEELSRRRSEEQQVRLAEHPSSEEIAAAIDGLLPLMWTRRFADSGFLNVRLGLGPRASLNSSEPPGECQEWR